MNFSKKLKPENPRSSAREGNLPCHILQKATHHTYLSVPIDPAAAGPHLGNTTLPASSSIHGEHRNDPDSNSKKHQGDLSWMPSVTGALLAPEMVLRRSLELVLLA